MKSLLPLCIVLLFGPLAAQDSLPTISTDAPGLGHTTINLPQKSLQVETHFGRTAFDITTSVSNTDPVTDQFVMGLYDLRLRYGIWDKLEVEVLTPFSYFPGRDDMSMSHDNDLELNPIQLGLRWQIYRHDRWGTFGLFAGTHFPNLSTTPIQMQIGGLDVIALYGISIFPGNLVELNIGPSLNKWQFGVIDDWQFAGRVTQQVYRIVHLFGEYHTEWTWDQSSGSGTVGVLVRPRPHVQIQVAASMVVHQRHEFFDLDRHTLSIGAAWRIHELIP